MPKLIDDIGLLSPVKKQNDNPIEKFAKSEMSAYMTASPRAVAGFAQGVAGTITGTGSALKWLGSKEFGQQVVDFGNTIKKKYEIQDPKFIDQLNGGVGSLATFYIPGAGIAKGVGITAKVAPVLASWLGVGASSILEAGVEAGSVYEQGLERSKTDPKNWNEPKASLAASKTFWTNLPMIAFTNKFGLFGDKGVMILKGLKSAGGEGIQEFSQSVISNIALNDPTFQGALESGAIGAITGGMAGTVTSFGEAKQNLEKFNQTYESKAPAVEDQIMQQANEEQSKYELLGKLEPMKTPTEQDIVSPKDTAKGGHDLKLFKENGGQSVLKKGGFGLDEMAQELQSSGDIQVPDDENPGDYLYSLITGKAKTTETYEDMGERAAREEFDDNSKRREFINTVKQAGITGDELRKIIESKHIPINNRATNEEARQLIEQNEQEAVDLVTGSTHDALSVATAELLILKYQQENNLPMARFVAERTAEKLTQGGQATQAASIISRLTPEGQIGYAISQVKKARESITPKKILTEFDKLVKLGTQEEIEAFAKKHNIPYLTNQDLLDIKKMAEEMAKLPEGRDRTVQQALIMKMVTDRIPVGFGKKVSMWQTIAMLSNPKTAVRNVIGNTLFWGAENISDTIATAIDCAVALKTGNRAVYMPDIPLQVSGMVKGAKESIQEIKLGIDLGIGKNDKWEMGRNTVFSNPVMQSLERALSYSLRPADRAFFQAAYNQSLKNSMMGAKTAEPTIDMINHAVADGLYRTYQDDSNLSKIAVGLKRTLNKVGIQGTFGLGDLVLKFPRTPANILARGIDYSPLGLITTAKTIYDSYRNGEFDQALFSRSLARVGVGGTLLMGTGAILAKLGILLISRDKKEKVRAVKDKQGLMGYQINMSALERFIVSGYNPEMTKPLSGDTLVSYDWAQPASINLTLGANLADGNGNGVVDNIVNTANSLVEQPLLTGLKKMFGGYQGALKSVAELGKGMPSTFIPSALNSVRMVTDNVVRNYKYPDTIEGNMAEMNALSTKKIPGMSENLTPQIDIFGNRKKYYPGKDNIVTRMFNAFVNPSIIKQFKPSPETELLMEIYDTTGQTGHIPRVIEGGDKIKLGKKLGGGSIELSPEQAMIMQEYIGKRAKAELNRLTNDKNFMALSDDRKYKIIDNKMSDLYTSAKVAVLGKGGFLTPQGNIQKIKENIDTVKPKRKLINDLGI